MKLKDFLIKIKRECNEQLTKNNIETFNIKKKIESEERIIKPERIFPKFINPETRRGILLILSIFSILFSIVGLSFGQPIGLLSLLVAGGTIYTTYIDYIKSPDTNYAKVYDLTELNERLNELEKEKNRLIELITDVRLCRDYTDYVLPPELKEIKVNFDTETIKSLGCTLSTLLHIYIYYHSNYEEFLKLDKETQKASQEYLNLASKIEDVIEKKKIINYREGMVSRPHPTKNCGYLLDSTLDHSGRRR